MFFMEKILPDFRSQRNHRVTRGLTAAVLLQCLPQVLRRADLRRRFIKINPTDSLMHLLWT
jgi:hypothetical protein